MPQQHPSREKSVPSPAERGRDREGAVSKARALRQNSTDAERRLWSRLRRNALGVNFRRQHPIPPYTVDFACVTAGIAIDVDGGQHAESRRDASRDAYLRQRGWTILRFWNNDVLTNTDGVLATIADALGPRTTPSPSLPRAAGEGATSVDAPR
jgi:very-short-patch-repair endonuclease